MALERRNPLPTGRYWVDIQAKYVADFTDFLRKVGRGIMVVQTKERTDPFTTGGGTTSYLFEVKDPLIWWDQSKFGFPTIGTGITDLDQTGQVPAPEPLFGGGGSGDWVVPALVLAAIMAFGR